MPPFTQPPDPNPRKPRLKVPAGAVDTHIHLFGPASQYPFDPGSRYISQDALPEDSIRLQEVLGFSHAVVVSGGGYGRTFHHLVDVLERFPQRFRGVALLPEQVSDADLKRLTALGVRGLRFVSPAHGAHLPHLDPAMAARAHEHGWHVQFYPAPGDIVDYEDKLLALPNDVVLDHFAAVPAAAGTEQPAFKTLLRLLDSGKVWVKLSGPMRCVKGDFPYAEVTPIAQALVRHAPERLVWGSDWPHVNMNNRGMPNDGDLVDLLGEWAPDEAVRHRILVDNPRRLYGFPA